MKPAFPNLFLCVVAILMMVPAGLVAQPDHCAALSSSQMETATAIMAKVYPHDCCDENLSVCMGEKAPSRLVKRLASEVCRRVADRQKEADILRNLERRGASMMGTGKKARMDLVGTEWAGEKSAQVEVVVYACARCPFCSKSVPEVYKAVTRGALKGKAKLAMRIFPVKSHEYSKEGGLALQAANSLGFFWPYLLNMYANFDRFCPVKLAEMAAEVGMTSDVFAAEMKKGETRKLLVASKKEGLRNQVEATPTYFIGGKLYRGDLKTAALLDAVGEEVERQDGTLCGP
jgi:hypothetical protein